MRTSLLGCALALLVACGGRSVSDVDPSPKSVQSGTGGAPNERPDSGAEVTSDAGVEAGVGAGAGQGDDAGMEPIRDAGTRPDAPPPLLTRSLTAGVYHTCFLSDGGTARCWGAGTRDEDCVSLTGAYQCGQAMPPDGEFSEMKAGAFHTCGLRPGGDGECWGEDSRGRLDVPSGPFTTLAPGYEHGCALRDDRSIACWGRDDQGQASPPPGRFVSLATAGHYNCAIEATDGTLFCWGLDLGEPPGGAYVEVTVSGRHACARDAQGSVSCWGAGTTASDCPPPGVHFNRPVECGQSLPPPGAFIQIASSPTVTCGVRPDQSVECWGDTYYGQTTVPPGAFTEVVLGQEHACARSIAGDIVCWGVGDVVGQCYFGSEGIGDHLCGQAAPPDDLR